MITRTPLLRGYLVVAFSTFVTLLSCAQTPVPITPPASTNVTGPVVLGALQRPSEVKGKYKDYLYKRYADDKEARAVIHLFGRKQTGGALWLITGAAFITFVTSETGTTTDASGTTTNTVTPLGYGLLVGLFGGVGIGKLARFSNTKLYETLMDYDQTHSFSSFAVSRIKDKDYK